MWGEKKKPEFSKTGESKTEGTFWISSRSTQFTINASLPPVLFINDEGKKKGGGGRSKRAGAAEESERNRIPSSKIASGAKTYWSGRLDRC